jgi:guanylate kinase
MNKKGLLLVLSGPSGCGKGTVLKELMAHEPNLFLSVSATTRSPRPGEENGVHYYFLSKDEFETEISRDGMLEHACYCNNYYGTPKKPVYDRCEKGEDVILEIEVQGAMQVLQKEEQAVSVFIMPPSMEELRRRLTDRQTEDAQTVMSRLETAKEEMKLAPQYDYIVVNHMVEEAAKELAAIIRAEKCKADRMLPIVREAGLVD